MSATPDPAEDAFREDTPKLTEVRLTPAGWSASRCQFKPEAASLTRPEFWRNRVESMPSSLSALGALAMTLLGNFPLAHVARSLPARFVSVAEQPTAWNPSTVSASMP